MLPRRLTASLAVSGLVFASAWLPASRSAGAEPARAGGAAELVPAAPLPPLVPLPGSAPDPAAAGAPPVPGGELGVRGGTAPAVEVAPLAPDDPGSAAVAVPAALGSAGPNGAPAPAPLEPPEPTRAAVPPPPAELTPSQEVALAFQMKSYLRQLHERIARAWAPPLSVAAVGGGGRRVALVTVVIARDGSVLDARIDRGSNDEAFDRSALRVLRRPYLFPPLPYYYGGESLEVGLRFADPRRASSR